MGTFFLLLGVNIVSLAIMFLFLQRKIEKRVNSTDILEQLREQIQGIIVDLNETTERNIGVIEHRIETLSRLVESADRRIQLLQSEQDKSDKSKQVYSDILKKRPVKPEVSPPIQPVEEIGSEDLKEKVLTLYVQGKTVTEIAQLMGVTIGEVELLISLGTRQVSE